MARPTAARPTAARPTMDDVEAQLAEQERRRSLARLGAYAQHAKHDPRETTRGAFQARMRRYELQVDPTGELKARDPQELATRVQAALKADMAKVRMAKQARTVAQAAEQARQLALAAQRQARRAQQAAAECAALREKITAQLRRTPPNNLLQLGTLLRQLQALELPLDLPREPPAVSTAAHPDLLDEHQRTRRLA